MAISIYNTWFIEKSSPGLDNGLSLDLKSTLIIFEIINARGNNGAEKQNVNRFFVNIGSEELCTIKMAPQIKIDASMKWIPFFCLFAISSFISVRVIIFSLFELN